MNKNRLLEVVNTILLKLHLLSLITAFRSLFILESEYGHYVSSSLWSSVDKDKNPIPWFTYPTIEYLKQVDFSKKSIFEWGSGNSTLFWASKSKNISSVEGDFNWYETGLQKTKDLKNVKLVWAPDKNTYIESIKETTRKYDVIVIDGSYRFDCTKASIKSLKHGGLIILDNSNWFPKTSRFLRHSGFIEIPMVGFAPIVPYVSVTSLFLSHGYSFKFGQGKSTQLLGAIGHSLG